MTQRQMIDVSGSSGLVVCTCGWRELVPPDRGAAWKVALQHGVRAHPGDNSDTARRLAKRWGTDS